MYKFFRLLIIVSSMLAGHQLAAQGLGNSPYSRIGLGDVIGNTGTIRNLGMGGTGVSAPNTFQLNQINPALLHYNTYTVLDFGIGSQVKRLSANEKTQVDGNATLSSLGISFPISKNWSASAGLKPFSSVEYKTTTTAPISGQPDTLAETTYQGSGGISEVYFAHGFKVAEGLTLGVSASYLFGSVINESSSRILNSDRLVQRIIFNDRVRYSDFTFKTGIAYRKEISENKYVAIGGVYSLGSDLDGRRRFLAQRRGIADNLVDEIVFSDSVRVTARLPHAFQLGLSFDNGKNWSLALDLTSQPWSGFRTIDGRAPLTDSYRIALGGEITPDPTSVESYFKRITYRAGISHSRTPLLINGNNVNESAFSWGFTLPLRKRPYPQEEHPFINTSFSVGRRGSAEATAIKETYFRFNIGLSINNRWFVKRRIS